MALTTAKWRERENGRIQRGPFPVDRTRVSVTEEHRNDQGIVTLSVQALDAGQAPRFHSAEGSAVTESDPELTELRFNTSALRLAFLAVDPRRGHPTGEPYLWKNSITIQYTVSPSADGRRIKLFARPSAAGIRYTVDASEPRGSAPGKAGSTYLAPVYYFRRRRGLHDGGRREHLLPTRASRGDQPICRESGSVSFAGLVGRQQCQDSGQFGPF